MQGSSELESPDAESDAVALPDELRNAVEENNFDRIEELWMELISDTEHAQSHLERLIGAGEDLWNKSQSDPERLERLGALLELLLS